MPLEKDILDVKGSTFTATLRGSSVPELEEHVERLKRSHGFGPSQAAQWLIQLAIDVRNALGGRWHEVAAIADARGVTPGTVLGELVLRGLESQAGQATTRRTR